MSLFGEHLIENEIANAVATAASELSLSILDYCVGPVAQTGHNHHLYLMEPATQPDPSMEEKLAEIIDAELCSQNQDYRDLRTDNLALAAPEVRLVAPGQFVRWMKARRGLGGQYKVPRIVTDSSLFKDIREAVLDVQKEPNCNDN